MKRPVLCFVFSLWLGLAACGVPATPPGTPTSTAVPATSTLTSTPTAVPSPTATPMPTPLGGGGLIAYISYTDGNNGPIAIYDLASGQTSHPKIDVLSLGATDAMPSAASAGAGSVEISPDGTRMAFSYLLCLTTAPGQHHIHCYHQMLISTLDGNDLQQLTKGTTDYFWPVWSGDGKRIRFVPMFSGEWTMMIKSDGSGLTQLPEREAGGAWLPDGKQMVVSMSKGGGENQLFLVNADNSGTASMLTEFGGGAYQPAWSHDGKDIAFTGRETAGAGRKGYDIWLLSIESKQVRNLTNGACSGAPVDANWSGDGTKIAFLCDRRVEIMNADGSGLRDLSGLPACDEISWFSRRP